MSATLKKLEEIKKRKQELQREEENLKTLFMEEVMEILSTLEPLKVDLDVLIGSMAITIEQASYENLQPSEKTKQQITQWRERGHIEMARFRRLKKSKSQKNEPKDDLNKNTKKECEEQNPPL